MRSFRLFSAFASLGLALAITAPAQLNAQNYSQGTVKLNNAGNVVSHGVYVGPYNGSMPGTPSIDFFCVDFLNRARLNTPWTARFTSLGAFFSDPVTALSRTRWGQFYSSSMTAEAITKMYQKGAWLATQFALNATSSWGGIHGAIWDTFTPTSNPTWAERVPWMNAASTAATNGFSGMNWNEWYVVTDVNTANGVGGTQEFLVHVTPEPETLLLLVTGLAALAVVGAVSRRGIA